MPRKAKAKIFLAGSSATTTQGPRRSVRISQINPRRSARVAVHRKQEEPKKPAVDRSRAARASKSAKLNVSGASHRTGMKGSVRAAKSDAGDGGTVRDGKVNGEKRGRKRKREEVEDDGEKEVKKSLKKGSKKKRDEVDDPKEKKVKNSPTKDSKKPSLGETKRVSRRKAEEKGQDTADQILPTGKGKPLIGVFIPRRGLAEQSDGDGDAGAGMKMADRDGEEEVLENETESVSGAKGMEGEAEPAPDASDD